MWGRGGYERWVVMAVGGEIWECRDGGSGMGRKWGELVSLGWVGDGGVVGSGFQGLGCWWW